MNRWVLESDTNAFDVENIESMTKDAFNVLSAFEFMGCIEDEVGSV